MTVVDGRLYNLCRVYSSALFRGNRPCYGLIMALADQIGKFFESRSKFETPTQRNVIMSFLLIKLVHFVPTVPGKASLRSSDIMLMASNIGL